MPNVLRHRGARTVTAERDANGEEIDVRFVQPYEATKRYLCPGCNRDIPAGTGHVVAVPRRAPDDRRHWHRGCWRARHRRPPR